MSLIAEPTGVAGRRSELPVSAEVPVARPVVLHVVEALADGTLRHVTDLVRCLAGVDHVIAGPSQHHGQSTERALSAARAAGAQIAVVEMGRFRAPHRHAAALRALHRTIARVRPDIVHGHSSIGGAMARLACIGTTTPVVYTPHGFSRFRWGLMLERMLRDRADRVIAVSASERSFALAHRVAREDQVVVILNGVDPEPPPPAKQSLRASIGISAEVPLVGCVGRLTWQKAPEVFVAACEQVSVRLPDAEFVLIGAGALQAVVAAAVREAGLEDRFHLIPYLPDAAAALAELDVFALPSRFEGAAYTPLEAMRAGTPVVVTDVAGNRDLVWDGENGLVVPPEEPEALAGAIVRLIDDDALRQRVVGSARRTVAGCDVRVMADVTAGVYRELCESQITGSPPAARKPVRAHRRSSATRSA